MQNKTNILRGVAVLSTGFVVSVVQPASADSRHRRDDRRDNKQERREERREDKQERREDRQERREDRRDDRRDNRYDNRNNIPHSYPAPRYNPQPRWNQQPNWNSQPTWNQQNVTAEGVVISDLRGNGFTLRTNTGQQFFVQVQGGESTYVSRGDVVRVFGRTNGNHFNALSIRILANR